MTGWTLILYIYAGMLAPDNSVALTHIQGFKTEMNCWAAGAAARWWRNTTLTTSTTSKQSVT